MTFTAALSQIILDSFDLVKDSVLANAVWSLDQLIQKTKASSAKNLFVLLMRQISCNLKDLKSRSLNIKMVELCQTHIGSWIFSSASGGHDSFFASLVLIKLLRLIEEHFNSIDLTNLRQREAFICVKIWQLNREECQQIGSEFFRIFNNICRLPDLQPIADELAQVLPNGKTLAETMFSRKSIINNGFNIYVQQLVPHEVETKLSFMLREVPNQSSSFYLKWFFEGIGLEYGQETESMLIDIVRFIIVNIHPSNEVIQNQSMIQRFMLIGTILSQQSHQIHQTWVLQALFFDWLCYQPEDPYQIMLVEPAMLLMYKSAENNPAMTDRLVEFLFNYVTQFNPMKTADYLLSVRSVLFDCMEKGVIKDIKRLINHHKLRMDT